MVVSSKKKNLKSYKFFELFCRSGVMKYFKTTKSPFSQYEPKIHRNYLKLCSEHKSNLCWLFGLEKIFRKVSNFLNFFAGPGSWNISKMTKSSFLLYEPKIHRNYLKWWSEHKSNLSWLFWLKKKIGENFPIF